MKAYKGFNNDMTCRGFQYEIGKTYKTDEAKICKNGFHACEYPLDCLGYYAPQTSKYCEVEQDGKIEKSNEDTKVCSTVIKIGAEIGIKGLVEAAISFVKERIQTIPNSATGDYSANSATGYGSANISTGIKCCNDGCNATLNAAWGKDSKCKGKIGAYLVLSEWGEWDGEKHPLIAAKMIKVDGVKYKEDVWYCLKKGKIVEVE